MRDVVTQEKREVESGGGLDTGTFSIMANGKAFRILIDGLYADKPRAIVRELWSNAYDAHRDAGKGDVPFECHLPTRFEPTFSVRDFGISLEHEDVMGLYTTVFKSTKENSNVGVGKFGLGSKTPFAYSDQFSVTVWKDGIKRLYNAYIDEDSIPKISLFHQEESNEPTGVEISFGVRPQDVDNFVRAAKTTIVGFDVPPILSGNTFDIESAIGVIQQQGDGWRLYQSRDRYSSSPLKTSVRQGCVVYPIDSGAMQTELRKRNIDLSILESGIVFDVEIGTVDITPSRESLSYDSKTVKNVADAIEKVLEQLVSSYLAKINNDKLRLVDFYENYSKIIIEARSSLPHSAYRIIENKAVWRGMSVKNSDLFYQKTINLKKRGINLIHCTRNYKSDIPGRWSDDAVAETFTYGIESCQKNYNGGYVVITQEKNEKITYAGARIRQYMQKIGNRKTVFWLSGTAREVTRLFVLLNRPANFDVLKLSDLDRPSYAMTPSTTTTKEKGTIWVKVFTPGEGIDKLKEARISEKNEGIYLGVVGQKWAGWGTDSMEEGTTKTTHIYDPEKWGIYIKTMLDLELIEKDTPIYIIPRRSKRGVERNSLTWTPFMQFVTQAILENVSKETASSFLQKREKSSLHREMPDNISSIVSKAKTSFVPSSVFGSVLHYFNALSKTVKDVENEKEAPFVELGIKLGIYDASIELIQKVKAEEYKIFKENVKKVEATYPLINEAFRYGIPTSSVSKLIDYIKMVDYCRDQKALEEQDIFPAE